MIAAFVNCDEL